MYCIHFQTVSSLLESDLRQRTGKADAALREAVTRLAHPKGLSEQLAQSVARSMQQGLQQELRDSLGNVLVPATERALQNMLHQVSLRLAQGVKEHEAKLQVSTVSTTTSYYYACTVGVRFFLPVRMLKECMPIFIATLVLHRPT